jgi:hypothetical protein
MKMIAAFIGGVLATLAWLPPVKPPVPNFHAPVPIFFRCEPGTTDEQLELKMCRLQSVETEAEEREED